MIDSSQAEAGHLTELRLLLEELCCDLCRFEHEARDAIHPGDVHIDREFAIGPPGAFADIRVAPKSMPPYFVEVKYGYSDDTLRRHLKRKYCETTHATAGASKIILVLDWETRPNREALERELTGNLSPGLALEIWDESRLRALLQERFQVEVKSMTKEVLLVVRHAIDRAKGMSAFGGASVAEYAHDPLKAELLWHFGFWRLRELRAAGRSTPAEILPTGLYRGVAVVMADLCSFSSYVRDTPNHADVRESLTSFYSKSRYQIINAGGMLDKFVGDEVIGFFGLPDRPANFIQQALVTAKALVSIGESVSQQWQRRIDRLQPSGGLHVGVAIGDLEMVSLRPFSQTHVGAIGDCINMAARLMAVAGPSEVVVSNSFQQGLDEENQADFDAIEPVEAKNVGRIKAWKLRR